MNELYIQNTIFNYITKANIPARLARFIPSTPGLLEITMTISDIMDGSSVVASINDYIYLKQKLLKNIFHNE